MQRWRIPGLIDLVTASERAAIHEFGESRALDRRLDSVGPLINRLLASRVRRALTIDGRRLPSIALRDDDIRAKEQAALAHRLDSFAGGKIVHEETLQALAAAVRDGSSTSIAIATQQAVGRWFVAGYIADAQTWQAACNLRAAANSQNPFRLLYLLLSGAAVRARGLLSERVEGSLAGVHATGIAVHNVVRGFEAMQAIWRDENLRHNLSAEAVVSRCLFAPDNVLRQATTPEKTSAGELEPGTLVLLKLGVAHEKSPGSDVTFMSHAWSHCPAAKAVPELLRAVWLRVLDEGGRRG